MAKMILNVNSALIDNLSEFNNENRVRQTTVATSNLIYSQYCEPIYGKVIQFRF